MANNQQVALDLHRKISGINWNQVYSFSLVATHGSIKRAAEILSLSPSALSEQISQLEGALEVKLFIRRGPKLILTEQGNRLFTHAKGMFEHGLRLLDAVSPIQFDLYPIFIGFVPGPNLPIAYRWVAKFYQTVGAVNLNLQHATPEAVESRLLKGQLDFGFSERKPKHPDLRFVRISKSAVSLYVSSELGNHSCANLLKRLPLLVCRPEGSNEKFIENALQKVDLVPSSVISSDFPSVLVDFCQLGIGVGAFCEKPVLRMNTQGFTSLKKPKDAPKVDSGLYVMWAAAAENTLAITNLKKMIDASADSPSFAEGVS